MKSGANIQGRNKNLIRNSTIIIILLLLFASPAQGVCDFTILQKKINHLADNVAALVGVSLFIDGKQIVSVNGAHQFPLQSVYKFHQALAVSHYLQGKGLSLEMKLPIAGADLHGNTWSPLRDKYPNGGICLSIRELLQYTLLLSDNNACDILFKYVCDPQYTEAYIRSLGLNGFAISATEKDMHEDLDKCYANRSTPESAARLLDMLINRKLAQGEGNDFIMRTMLDCETGKARLPAPLAGKKALIGHKTGTGDKNSHGEIIAVNDLGFVILPDGRKYVLAVFIENSLEDVAKCEKIIAQISEAVYDCLSSPN